MTEEPTYPGDEPPPKVSEAVRYFGSSRWLFNVLGGVNLSIMALGGAAIAREWKWGLVGAAGLVYFGFDRATQFLWRDADWFRGSVILQVLIQVVCVAISLVTSTSTGTAAFIGLGLSLLVWGLHMIPAWNYCKANGLPLRTKPYYES